MAQLINVSNRLPVTIGEDGEVRKSSGGLVAALEGLPEGEFEVKWIGWPGGVVEEGKQEEVREKLAGSRPVFLSKAEEEGFYEGFSNTSVWPLLHYMQSYMRYEEGWWEAYRTVNERFAREVLAVAREGDLVWVHDYQLMLVPGILRRERTGLRVGFFLHTPFPSYEVFRCHPKRVELLEGMLGADLVGFHTPGYMRHFRSSCVRLLEVESEITRVRQANGRTTTMGVYPIGINAKKFEEGLDTEAFKVETKKLREAFGEKRLVVSVERLDYTKGILRRLDAIELFLAGWERMNEIKFLFVAVPSREGVEEYQQLLEEIESRVGRINGKYATLHSSPIHFIHGSVEFAELLALYAEAEVAMVTPLRDGMNLVAKEYVAAQREKAGVLVLSEFAGAAEEMFQAVIVNPYDVGGVARGIGEALAMPVEERERRMRPMRERVMRFDAAAWARGFVEDLRSIEEEKPEDGKEMREVLKKGGKRVGMFIDYDGTLRELVREPWAARPTADLMKVLKRLGEVPGLDVTIVSGRRMEDLDAWLGESGFGLVAEHGARVRRPGEREWERLDVNVDYGWKEEVTRVLRGYERSTPGSFIEEKQTGVVWHYRKAEAAFGEWKARQLMEELLVATANLPLEVRHGKKIVEIVGTQVNKGAAVMRLLEGKKYDLVIVAGDDVTDESMFRLSVENLVSIKVGDGATAARYRVRGPGELRELLALVSGSQTDMGPGVRLSQA